MKRTMMMMAMLLMACIVYGKDIKTVVLTTTPQMQCSSCEEKIKGNMRFEKGVKSIETNIEEQSVTIQYDADKTNEAKLIKAFEKFGYKAEKKEAPEKVADKKDCCEKADAKKECGKNECEKKECSNKKDGDHCKKDANKKDADHCKKDANKKDADHCKKDANKKDADHCKKDGAANADHCKTEKK